MTGIGTSLAIGSNPMTFGSGILGAVRSYNGGIGSITNLHQLILINSDADSLARSYALSNDIDASATNGQNASDIWGSSGFISIGSTYGAYRGEFDGRAMSYRA